MMQNFQVGKIQFSNIKKETFLSKIVVGVNIYCILKIHLLYSKYVGGEKDNIREGGDEKCWAIPAASRIQWIPAIVITKCTEYGFEFRLHGKGCQ